MSLACLVANAESFSYEPGVALCIERARSESCVSASASSAEEVAMSGAIVCGLQPVHCVCACFFDFFFFVVCAAAGNEIASATKNARANGIVVRRNFPWKKLVVLDGRVRIFPE